MSTNLPQQIAECVAHIRAQGITMVPEAAIILGTGLGGLIRHIEVEHTLDYADLPHFVRSTVESHHGKLVFGKLEGKRVVCMQGRFHYYEGYDLAQITFPVRVLRALGAPVLLVSNAAGAIDPLFRAGDLMLITDHINLLGTNPLVGRNFDELGPRWPDMCEPYSHELLEKAREAALEARIPVQQGVYACMSGPSLETRAEYRMLKVLGAHAIGMSTVPEVIVAIHGGMKVLGMSALTDECFPDALEPCDISKILANAAKAEPRMVEIFRGVLRRL